MLTNLSYRQLINGVVALMLYLLPGDGSAALGPLAKKPIKQDPPVSLHCEIVRGTKFCDFI